MEVIILVDRLFSIFKRYKELAVIVISLIIGFTISSGLLLYSGKELVNSLIYLGVIVLLPFLLSLAAAIKVLFIKNRDLLEGFKISFLSGVFFSLGALLSLLFTIITSDIAFGWATTLDVKPNGLSSFLNSLAIWKVLCKSCIVSEHLGTISQFSRLGGSVDKSLISNAKELGAWWRYLAFAILTYGVAFRAIFYLFTSNLINKKKLKIVAQNNSEIIKEIDSQYKNRVSLEQIKRENFRVVSYYIDSKHLKLKGSSEAKNIVVAVKSWEPPILDFFDYLDELKEDNPSSKISIYLVGLSEKAQEEDAKIWQRKLNELNLNYEVIV